MRKKAWPEITMNGQNPVTFNQLLDLAVSVCLIWLSMNMFRQNTQIPEEHRTFYLIFAVLFLIAGAFFLFRTLRMIRQNQKEK
ncbi:MAG: hypothetical protein IJJ44_00375 [Solobacterium sp.]|nr:hypothetical protein [Solobacterium sp.]